MTRCGCVGACKCTLSSTATMSVAGDGSNETPWTFTPLGVPFTRPGAIARNSVVQLIANNTVTTVALGTEVVDQNNCYDLGTPTRINVTKAGFWYFFTSLTFPSNATGLREARLVLNTTTILSAIELPTITGLDFHFTLDAMGVFAVGDFVEVAVRQTSGGGLNLNSDTNRTAFLGGVFMGRTS